MERTDMQRFMAFIEYADNGCWLFQGMCNAGYGQFTLKREAGKQRTARAHRWYYEQVVGPIPEGLTLDHTCHGPGCPGGEECLHRRCVNPEHLEPVTNRENMLRHNHANPNRREDQCRNGHDMTEDNIWRVEVTQNGKRVVKERCLQCHRDRARESGNRRYHAKKQKEELDTQRSILSEGKPEFWI